MVGQLAGGVAHDFNTCSHGVSTATARHVADGADERDPTRRELEAIREAGERAAQLTPSACAVQPQSGVRRPREVDVNDLVQRVGVMLRRLISEIASCG
jgi:hypothetical protein